MNKLTINNLSFDGFIDFSLIGKKRDVINDFSTSFDFGKCYCIDSDLGNGSWALSWIVSGKVKQGKGFVSIDGNILNTKKRKKNSQCVGIDGHGFIMLKKKTIENQILEGLRRTNFKNAKDVLSVAEMFKLNKLKLDRILRHVSAMRFKASMAIGHAFDKKVYCFPWMAQDWISNFDDIWLRELILYLKSTGALIIIPTKYSQEMKGLFDEVVEINN